MSEPSLRQSDAFRAPAIAGALVGYQLDTDLEARTRIAFRVLFASAVVGFAAALVYLTHAEPLPIRDNIQILSTLENFTRDPGPGSGNTIPSFITSAGRLGVLRSVGEPRDPVRAIQESDLRQGFCSQNVARQVRHEYPGFYERWPDDKLERTFLEKYPQYADRVCVLSVRFDAEASEIIKYEITRSALLAHAAFLWLRTLLLTTMFAVICLNVYYRLIVGHAAPSLDAAA